MSTGADGCIYFIDTRDPATPVLISKSLGVLTAVCPAVNAYGACFADADYTVKLIKLGILYTLSLELLVSQDRVLHCFKTKSCILQHIILYYKYTFFEIN